MSTAWRRLFLGSPTAETTLYTAPDKVIVREILIANNGGTAGTASVSLVPVAGTAGTSNRIVPTGFSVAANDTAVIDLVQVLNVGDFLSGIVSSSNLVITISGIGGV